MHTTMVGLNRYETILGWTKTTQPKGECKKTAIVTMGHSSEMRCRAARDDLGVPRFNYCIHNNSTALKQRKRG